MKPKIWLHVVTDISKVETTVDSYERRYRALGITGIQRNDDD